MMARSAETYRGARRGKAKDLKIDWRKIRKVRSNWRPEARQQQAKS
jgi:hypothetical protein